MYGQGYRNKADRKSNSRFMDEINGSGLTGFNPYEKNGKIYFNQRWLMMIGKKL